MKQGTSAASFADRKNDLYETPPEAVHSLLKHFQFIGPVWEPCAGRGAISRVLKQYGHTVIAQDLCAHEGADPDIISRVDFLMERVAPAALIITNPPYKLADEFVRHSMYLGCVCVVLLRLVAIEGAGRSDIMSKCRYIYAGIERLPMMHRDQWDGPQIQTSSTPFAWFVFDPHWSGLTTLERISWRTGKDGLSV